MINLLRKFSADKSLQKVFQNRKTHLLSLQNSLNLKAEELALPFKLYGTNTQLNQKTSFICQRIFGAHSINPKALHQHLFRIFRAIFLQLPNPRSQLLDQYVQKGLRQRLRSKMDSFLDSGRKVRTFEQIISNQGEVIQTQVEPVDFALIRGLDVDRQSNRSYNDYIVKNQHQDLGLSIYMYKGLADPQNFIHRNDHIYSQYKKAIFRIMLRVVSNLRAQVQNYQMDLSAYSWQHTVVFQSQMIEPQPLQSKYKTQTLIQWLARYRFGKWYLADLDFEMEGNPLITKDSPRAKFQDEVFRESKLDPRKRTDMRVAW